MYFFLYNYAAVAQTDYASSKQSIECGLVQHLSDGCVVYITHILLYMHIVVATLRSNKIPFGTKVSSVRHLSTKCCY